MSWRSGNRLYFDAQQARATAFSTTAEEDQLFPGLGDDDDRLAKKGHFKKDKYALVGQGPIHNSRKKQRRPRPGANHFGSHASHRDLAYRSALSPL